MMSLLVVVGMAVPSEADACLRTKRRRVQKVDHKLQDVNRAEHLLAQGEGSRAAKVARKRFRKFTAATGEPDSGKALFNRAQRTIALAAVRSGGAIDLGKGMRGKTAQGRVDNLAWATSILEIQAAAEPDNLLLRTYLAEALMHHPGGDMQAVELLSQLANDDLMPTARGFALLAQGQQRLGDVSGRDLSLQRCRELGEGDDICTVA
ncbi:MAG: hypothetical protein KUG77_29045 [Nannocystaceae bacterium]|nr:hypothetical protein [Nannocystaceae bacterium]